MTEHPIQEIKGQCPSKSNQYRIIRIGGHGSLTKTKQLKEYEETFAWQAGLYRDLNIQGLFELHIDVYFRSKRSDLDNSLKVCLDSMQKINAIKNDNNCTKIVARKFIDRENPRIIFKLIEL